MTKPLAVNRKSIQVILNILLAAAVLAAFCTAVFGEDCLLFGYKPYLVASESMEPEYKKYALVLIKYNTYDEVIPGDVIAFKAGALGGKPALHRVVSALPQGYVTKGDANPMPDDGTIGQTDFLGREVWHTNITAKIIPKIKTPGGFISLVILPILTAILIVFMIRFGRPGLSNHKEV